MFILPAYLFQHNDNSNNHLTNLLSAYFEMGIMICMIISVRESV